MAIKRNIAIKVTKKDERLARALLTMRLLATGFPHEIIMERVNEGWPGELESAKGINKMSNSIKDYELDLMTFQTDIDKWSS